MNLFNLQEASFYASHSATCILETISKKDVVMSEEHEKELKDLANQLTNISERLFEIEQLYYYNKRD